MPPDHRHEFKILIPITLLDMTTITLIDHGMSLSVLYFRGQTIPSVYYSLQETVFSNISSTLLLVDFMLVASGGVFIFRKDFIAIYLIYIINNSKRFYHVRS